MSSQYGELRPTNGWDLFRSLWHPSKFQRVSRHGSVTAWHSSGHQPNFAALNRGCHLYSAGRPSRWALVHILVHWFFTTAKNTASQWSQSVTAILLVSHSQLHVRHANIHRAGENKFGKNAGHVSCWSRVLQTPQRKYCTHDSIRKHVKGCVILPLTISVPKRQPY